MQGEDLVVHIILSLTIPGIVYSHIAQLVEHMAVNHGVVGSSPTVRARLLMQIYGLLHTFNMIRYPV